MIKHVLLFFVFISFSVSANDFFRADSRTPDGNKTCGRAFTKRAAGGL
ncbi:enterotoxin A family protein [Escherichia coli]